MNSKRDTAMKRKMLHSQKRIALGVGLRLSNKASGTKCGWNFIAAGMGDPDYLLNSTCFYFFNLGAICWFRMEAVE
jgi:hypothetical protein